MNLPVRPSPARMRRSLLVLAAILAVLALRAAGAGDGAPPRGPAPAAERGPGSIAAESPTLASPFLPGGAALEPSVRRAGPRAGVTPTAPALFPPRPRTSPAARPAFARRLAAARDGSLSARSTGLPPPPLS